MREIDVLCDDHVRYFPIGFQWGFGAPPMGQPEDGGIFLK